MRLWHEALIPYLPRQQLLGQHRECCALRGLGWGKKHATVDYVFTHPYGWLVEYHYKVMLEMLIRGYSPDNKWYDHHYRGKKCARYYAKVKEYKGESYESVIIHCGEKIRVNYIYPEHDDAYLQECLGNLADKSIVIEADFCQYIADIVCNDGRRRETVLSGKTLKNLLESTPERVVQWKER